MSTPFKFKQFDVFHDHSALKVNTDGVLLGAWCKVDGLKQALDVGTGTGVIALMLAQRNAEILVDAVELDEPSALEAAQNADGSAWSNRVKVHHTDIVDFHPHKKYDLIVSNPPFFQNSTPASDHRKSNAKHQATLTVQKLLGKVEELLEDDGAFNMILPFEYYEEIPQWQRMGWHVHRLWMVYPKPGKKCSRMLLTLGKNLQPVELLNIIIRNEDNSFTEEYMKLTKDFYLAF